MQAHPTRLRRQCLATALAGTAWLLAACATRPLPAPPAPPAAENEATRRDQALRALGFQPIEDGWEFTLNGRLLFGTDADGLDAEALATAERLGHALAQLGVEHVRVEGHSDSLGSHAYNQALSLRRAQTVARVLEDAGLRARIEVVGLGKTAPISDNRTPQQRQQNRRVAVVVPSQ
ncbi:OmpA family protein [Pseudorhodoferax sp.]|uniref:OmpA family protein n=1 Tax=Pseudorhodoferax sp. TaxID=1993553 RepID=UPI0039E6CFC2